MSTPLAGGKTSWEVGAGYSGPRAMVFHNRMLQVVSVPAASGVKGPGDVSTALTLSKVCLAFLSPRRLAAAPSLSSFDLGVPQGTNLLSPAFSMCGRLDTAAAAVASSSYVARAAKTCWIKYLSQQHCIFEPTRKNARNAPPSQSNGPPGTSSGDS